MHRTLLLSLACVVACVTPYRVGMDEWVGARRDEWVSVWGYPQQANDVVAIDDETLVYSYRSATCVVSVTFVGDVIRSWRYNGANCPRGRRPAGLNGSTAPQP